MLTEEGVIKKVRNRKAEIRLLKISACSRCEHHGSCEVFSGEAKVIEVPNDLKAEVGDHVEISMPERSLMKISLLVYFFPIVALIVGACAGQAWAASLNMPSTLAAIVGGGLAMASTFLVLRWFDRSGRLKDEYHPRMTRILFSGSSLPRSDDSK
jgi:sigma-E factor negative regulatory protein RseC